MSDTTRTLLIALGVALLVAVLLPILFMTGMMASMMGGGMMDGGMMGGGMWLMAGLVLLVLIAGALFVAVGMRRR